MATIIQHTAVDEVRQALNALSSGSTATEEFISDAQIRRVLFQHARPQAGYGFQRYSPGLWVNSKYISFQYWNMQMVGVGTNIYQLNSTGSIETPALHTIPLLSAGLSPVYMFIVDGNYEQHFDTAGQLVTVRGPLDINGAEVAIADAGVYTIVDATYDSGSDTTEVTVDEAIPDSGTEDGTISFAPVNTDTRANIVVTAVLIDFNESMHDILFAIATAHSREKLQVLMGNQITLNPYEALIQQANRYRGIFSA
jgi:hypothetical protein